MGRAMRSRGLAVLLLGLALLLGPALALSVPAASAAEICDAGAALTPVGLDTADGRVLLAVPPLGNRGDGWLVEVAPGAESARAWRDPAAQLRGRFGGSVGPGPVLALRPCGDSCLQPVRWQAGAWKPLGEPLPLPAVSTAGLTYDLTGAPWIVIHRAAEKDGQVRAWAFRLEGREWMAKGTLTVSAVGDLQAVPAPQRKDGVLSGTGLFSASGPPETWVTGLPTLPPAKQGQLIALGGGFAGYLSADGAIYLSGDTGKTWRRSTWTPWGAGTTGIWRQGSDFWVDLPLGDRQGRMQLAWFDRRVPSAEKLVLSRLNHDGTWVQLASAGSEVTTKNDRLPLSHLLVPEPDVWLLLSGCAATADGSFLVVRTYRNGALGNARLVPLRPAS